MNDTRLRIYLNDHMALMTGEIELADRSRSNNEGRRLANVLERIRDDVRRQKSSAEEILARLNGSEDVLKKGAVWLAEKAARFKLNDALVSYSDLSRVDELEGLISGAQERVLLWETIQSFAGSDPRLASVPSGQHLEQSREHLEELCEQRKTAAAEAFA